MPEVYMQKIILPLLTLVLILAACQTGKSDIAGEKVNVDGGSYTNIDSQQLNMMLKKKGFVMVNVHIPFAGNIHDTDLSIPYDRITESQYLAQLPVDKNARIVLYCRSGRMSQIAADELVSLGYTNIWNLKNGMVEWEHAGFKLEK